MEKKEIGATNPQDQTLSKISEDLINDVCSDNQDYKTFADKNQLDNFEKESSASGKSIRTSFSVTKPDSEIYHALFNFTKSFVGIGALTIPGAMRHAGTVLGVFGIISCGLLWLYGVNIMVLTRRKLLKSLLVVEEPAHYLPEPEIEPHREARSDEAEDGEQEEDHDQEDDLYRITGGSNAFTDRVIHGKHRIKTYSDLARETYGDLGYHSVNLILFVQQMTVVSAYFFFLDRYFPSYVVLIGITPICMFWDLKRISYVSLSSLILIIVVLTTIIFVSIFSITDHSKAKLEYANVVEFPLFFGVWVFQFEGNTSWLQIENSMKQPKLFKKVSSIGISAIIIFKSLFALFAYLAFVENTGDIIFDSLSNSSLRHLLGYMYCGAIIGSMPIQVNPVADTVYRMKFLDSSIRIFRENPTTKYYIGALITVWICASVALLIPSLQLMLNVVGSLCGVFTMSIFPVLFYNKIFWNEISWKRYLFHLGMTISIFAAGMASIVYTLIHEKNH